MKREQSLLAWLTARQAHEHCRQPASSSRGRRLERALQADRHRHERGREGRAVGVRAPDPEYAGRDEAGSLT